MMRTLILFLGLVFATFILGAAGAASLAPLLDELPIPLASVAGSWAPCLIFGECTPGGSGRPEAAELWLPLLLVLCAALIVRWGWRSAAADEPASGQAGARCAIWLAAVGGGLTMAAAAGTVLEASGWWTALALRHDPYAELGAPASLSWLLSATFMILGAIVLRVGRRWWGAADARRAAAGVLASAFTVWLVAVVVHTFVVAEPVQGRYYKIPGLVVGRAQNYEYGTYLGMLGAASAALAALLLLACRCGRTCGATAGRALSPGHQGE